MKPPAADTVRPLLKLESIASRKYRYRSLVWEPWFFGVGHLAGPWNREKLRGAWRPPHLSCQGLSNKGEIAILSRETTRNTYAQWQIITTVTYECFCLLVWPTIPSCCTTGQPVSPRRERSGSDTRARSAGIIGLMQATRRLARPRQRSPIRAPVTCEPPRSPSLDPAVNSAALHPGTRLAETGRSPG